MDCLVLISKNKGAETNKFKPAAMANSVHLGDTETEIKFSNECLVMLLSLQKVECRYWM